MIRVLIVVFRLALYIPVNSRSWKIRMLSRPCARSPLQLVKCPPAAKNDDQAVASWAFHAASRFKKSSLIAASLHSHSSGALPFVFV